MGRFGDVLGLPFALEGGPFSPRPRLGPLSLWVGPHSTAWHLAMLIPMAISGIVGSFCVVAVNSWMNYPTGFMMGDIVAAVDPWAAMFNPLAWLQFTHVVGRFPARRARGRRCLCCRSAPWSNRCAPPFGVRRAVPVRLHRCGDPAFCRSCSGLQVGDKQSSKLAAFELALHTQPGPAPLGWRYLMSHRSVGVVRSPGRLDHRPRHPQRDCSRPRHGSEIQWPPVNITHWSFQSMVGIGSLSHSSW